MKKVIGFFSDVFFIFSKLWKIEKEDFLNVSQWGEFEKEKKEEKIPLMLDKRFLTNYQIKKRYQKTGRNVKY